jgi:putative tricarboxylic transport membrane protein
MRPDNLSSIFWMAVSLLIMYSSFKLKLGNLVHPGPGFLPFMAGLILCVLSILVFLIGGRGAHDGKARSIRQLWEGMNWSKTIVVTVALLLYPLIFTHLGFLLTTTLLLIFLLRAIEPVRWFVAVGGALMASFVSFAVFALWLQVQLPRGMIESFFF